jgi:acetate kinase
MEVLERVRTTFRGAVGADPEIIAIRALFGGEIFRSPAEVSADTLRRMKELIPGSPIHGPRLVQWASACPQAFPDARVVVTFETAFFADLPRRERVYGVSPDLSWALGMRRYGFHGLYHEAACRHVVRQSRRAGTLGPPRILSVCLDRKPEVAAAVACRPVTVTGGMTPIEGIPGETTCGEIDPSIVLSVAERLAWGPEEIDRALTRRSGLAGLAGRRVTLATVFRAQRAEHALARDVVQYRLLQACGAGMAAMGGVDAVVFSGRFVRLGRILGPWIVSRLAFQRPHPVPWYQFHHSADRIAADAAAATAIAACGSISAPTVVG